MPESAAPHAAVPDPLAMQDGSPVTTADQWRTRRRLELLGLFQEYVYGLLPPSPTAPVRIHELLHDAQTLGGLAELHELELAIDEPARVRLRLLLVLPRKRTAAAPTLLGINGWGNHMLLDHPGIALPVGWVPEARNNRASEPARGSRARNWPIERILTRGYALASFYGGDVSPDRAEERFSFTDHHGRQITTGTLAAWAWGLGRVMDALVAHDAVDAQRIGVVGHSRRGKAAMLAAAFDERFALAIAHQAGCGGTAPSRTQNPRGETLAVINRIFPHWFNDRFKMYSDRVEHLPVDQHELIALAAPRPVLLSNAEDDHWADPPGQFRMLQAADRVYHLLGSPGLGSAARPSMHEVVGETLGYFLRPGGHAMTAEDWDAFLDFADHHMSNDRQEDHHG